MIIVEKYFSHFFFFGGGARALPTHPVSYAYAIKMSHAKSRSIPLLNHGHTPPATTVQYVRVTRVTFLLNKYKN